MEDALKPQRDPIASTKLIVGLFFTAVGLLMTADNLDLFDAGRILRYWPAVLIVAGVIKLADPGRRLMGTILTVAGVVLLASTAGWLRVSIFDLWPLLIIGAGVAMVLRALGLRPALSVPRSDGNNILSILGARKAANTSPDFRGMRIGAFLSGVEVDLTGADIAQSPAIIECFAVMGSIELYVPETWDVVGEVVPIMAGFEVRTSSAADPKRQLVVRGTGVMAGIEVKRRKEQRDATN